jgi:hypothetical protein
LERVQHERGMRIGSTRAHLGCHPDRLHQFLWRRPARLAALVWPLMQYGHWVTLTAMF